MEPLAYTIRPTTLEEFVGQEHLVGVRGPLRVAIEQKHLFSFILWGPPGVGKTTLARIYAHSLDAGFFVLLAGAAGGGGEKEKKGGATGARKVFVVRIYADSLDAVFFELSAVAAGKDDIRKIADADTTGKQKVLFLD